MWGDSLYVDAVFERRRSFNIPQASLQETIWRAPKAIDAPALRCVIQSVPQASCNTSHGLLCRTIWKGTTHLSCMFMPVKVQAGRHAVLRQVRDELEPCRDRPGCGSVWLSCDELGAFQETLWNSHGRGDS